MSRRRLLDAKEVAVLLHCHYRTVYQMRRRGQLPAIPLGGVWRFDPKDINEFIERNKTHAKS